MVRYKHYDYRQSKLLPVSFEEQILLFLYNSGARVQEAADLRVQNLDLDPPARVRLHGKGDKWRTCPLWESTVALLSSLLDARRVCGDPEARAFTAEQGRPLTRFGIYRIVAPTWPGRRAERDPRASDHPPRAPPHHGRPSP
jgi:integrase/recombinase XerD